MGNHFRNTDGTAGAWATLSVDGTAPTGTATVSVLVCSWAGNIRTSYFDDVSVTSLGAPIAGESFVWCLAAGSDGRIYGGT